MKNVWTDSQGLIQSPSPGSRPFRPNNPARRVALESATSTEWPRTALRVWFRTNTFNCEEYNTAAGTLLHAPAGALGSGTDGCFRDMIEIMLTRYISAAMKRARYKTLDDGTCFGQIAGLAGVWANERVQERCKAVLQEVLEEWLILKIRDHDPIPRLGRVSLSLKAA
jgi:hypothetical protein